MADEALRGYLETEAAAGRHAGTDGFTIDLGREREKRAAYTLPEPGLWAVRVVQGMVRLGTTGVRIVQSRDRLEIVGRLSDELGPELCLAQTFRNLAESDARYPLRGGLLAALGREYLVEVHWSENGQRQVMSLAPGGERIAPSSLPMALPAIEVHAWPSKRGLLARLFSLADFSSEFLELSRRTFMAPIPVTLDQRPCDFASSFAAHFYPAQEFRGVRATTGPKLQLLPSVTRGLARPGLGANEFYEPMGVGGYAFLLSVGWTSERARMSTACWVHDGALVDEEPLFEKPSALHMTLFLPATALPTDATGMSLRKTPERGFRLREARLWAATSLKTHLPPAPEQEPLEESRRRLLDEIETRMAEALEGYDFTKNQARNFQDAIETHLAALERKQRTAQTVTENEKRLQEQRSLERWGRFMTYTPPAEELLYREPASPPVDPVKVKKFFGEVYVELPGRLNS